MEEKLLPLSHIAWKCQISVSEEWATSTFKARMQSVLYADPSNSWKRRGTHLVINTNYCVPLSFWPYRLRHHFFLKCQQHKSCSKDVQKCLLAKAIFLCLWQRTDKTGYCVGKLILFLTYHLLRFWFNWAPENPVACWTTCYEQQCQWRCCT